MANERGEKARIRSQLGPIGEFLEGQGDAGLAAAVRSMAFLLSQYRPSTLLDAIVLAAARLRESGQPEMAEAIEAGMTILEARRPDVSVAIDVSSSTHDVFAAHPGLEDQIRAWMDDPAPKVSGLRIKVGTSFEAELFVELAVDNDPSPPLRIFRIQKAGEPITGLLDKAHRAMIARLRKQRVS